MKMFCPPTDKTCKRCQKGAEWGLLAVLAPFVSGGAGIFEISTHPPFPATQGAEMLAGFSHAQDATHSPRIPRLTSGFQIPPIAAPRAAQSD